MAKSQNNQPKSDPKKVKADNGNNEAALFEAADRLRGSVESAEYKHLVLGLVFLKYISDSFEQRRAKLAVKQFVSEDRLVLPSSHHSP